MSQLDAETAFNLIEAAHDAWAGGDVDKMLESYVDDMVSITNTGPDGRPLILEGKAAFRARFEPILRILDSKTFIADFQFRGPVARIRFLTYLRHRATGLELTGSYREICTFRDGRIWKIEDIHDAAMMAAFWGLVAAETGQQVFLTGG